MWTYVCLVAVFQGTSGPRPGSNYGGGSGNPLNSGSLHSLKAGGGGARAPLVPTPTPATPPTPGAGAGVAVAVAAGMPANFAAGAPLPSATASAAPPYRHTTSWPSSVSVSQAPAQIRYPTSTMAPYTAPYNSQPNSVSSPPKFLPNPPLQNYNQSWSLTHSFQIPSFQNSTLCKAMIEAFFYLPIRDSFFPSLLCCHLLKSKYVYVHNF